MAPKKSSTSITINPRKALAMRTRRPSDSENEQRATKRVRFNGAVMAPSPTAPSYTVVDENDPRLADAYDERGALKVTRIVAKNETRIGLIEYLSMLAPPFTRGEVFWSLADKYLQADVDAWEQRDCDGRRHRGLPAKGSWDTEIRNREQAMERARHRRLAMGILSPPAEMVDVRRPGYDGVPLDLTAEDGTSITGYYHAKTAAEKAPDVASANGRVNDE